MADKNKAAIPADVKRRLAKIHVLSHAEIDRLLSVITDLRDQALFLVAYRHGIRASEVALLERTHVDAKGKKITIPRLTRRPSSIHPLEKDETAALRRYLKTRKDSSVVLFLGPRGKPISRRGLDWLMKHYGAEAKLPAHKRHFHTLKHSIATHLLSAGKDLRVVHEWLGHSLLQSTAVYLYLVADK